MLVGAIARSFRPATAGGLLLFDDFDTGDGYALNNNIPVVSPNWNLLWNTGAAAANVSPLSVANITRTDNAQNIRIGYAGSPNANQAVEMVVDTYVGSNRADPTLFVRRTKTDSIDGDCIRAFWKTSTSELIIGEFVNNLAIQTFTYSGLTIPNGTVLRLEVSGATAVAKRNGVQVGSPLTGLTVATGVPGWGAYLGNSVNDRVAFRSAKVENL